MLTAVDTLSQSYSSQRVLYLLVGGCRLHPIKQNYYPLYLSNNSSLWHSTVIFLHSCSCSLHSITSRPSVCVQAVTTISRYFTKCCCQHKPARFPGGCFCHESRRFSKAEKWNTAHDCILSQTSLIRLATDYTLLSDFSAFKMKKCTCSALFLLFSITIRRDWTEKSSSVNSAQAQIPASYPNAETRWIT